MNLDELLKIAQIMNLGLENAQRIGGNVNRLFKENIEKQLLEDPHNICIGHPPAFEVGKIKVEEEECPAPDNSGTIWTKEFIDKVMYRGEELAHKDLARHNELDAREQDIRQKLEDLKLRERAIKNWEVDLVKRERKLKQKERVMAEEFDKQMQDIIEKDSERVANEMKLMGMFAVMKDEILKGVGEMIQEHLSICLSVDGASFTISEKQADKAIKESKKRR